MGETDPTVFVVDDEPEARDGVAALASSMGLQVDQFESSEEFLAAYDPARPGCLVADVVLPGMNGLELLDVCTSRGWSLPVIIISARGDITRAVRAMHGGAITFLEKPYRNDELSEAIALAVRADKESRQWKTAQCTMRRRLEGLSELEQAVMDMIIEGIANKVIARRVDLSPRTVDRIRAKVFEKLGVESAVELARQISEYRSRRDADTRIDPRPPRPNADAEAP